MRLGYNWKFGPFELIDQLGPAGWLAGLKAEGKPVPALLRRPATGLLSREDGKLQFLTPTATIADQPRPPKACCCSPTSSARQADRRKRSASLWDIGDGVACLEFTAR